MLFNNKKLIAVLGATGQQGGAVVRALQASSQFKVRTLSRNPDKHRELFGLAGKVGNMELIRTLGSGRQWRVSATRR